MPGNPVDEPVTIEADDKDFTFDVNGNAVLSGNVVMRQGDKVIRADRLEYDAKTGQRQAHGRASSSRVPRSRCAAAAATYSPALGAQFEGAQFELPAAQRARRGAQHAGGRQRHGDAGRRVVHHLPGHRRATGR